MYLMYILLFTLLKLSLVQKINTETRPNIIFILADDLGWNDVGFHGAGDIRTPNIDALAYTGLILQNYYVTPICTPSRSALMTGKYPIHTGMQHTVLFGAEPRGLPLTHKLLPEYLKDLGYSTRIVGKWHLGSYKAEYTPTHRGFDSHLGYWTGHQDYYDHTAMEKPGWGFDMRNNMSLAYDLHGKYSTDVFGDEAVRLINEHDAKNKPLFLYLAHAAVHSANPYNPLPAPDDTVEAFNYVEDYKRRRFAAMLSKMDDTVGAVVQALAKKQMLDNSVIVFSTDNGGPAAGFNLNAASNFPLRGVKNTLWEGGVRGAGVLWSPLLGNTPRVAKQRMHISDWLPTLLAAAGMNDLGLEDKLDGVDLWPALKNNVQSPRMEILHNIDDIYGSSALTIGPWKIVKGTNYNGIWDGWYGPSGYKYEYNTSLVLNSVAAKALKSINKTISLDTILNLRQIALVNCKDVENGQNKCNPLKETCLFNIVQDPCEKNNVAAKYPKILQNLLETLENYNKTALPPGNLPLDPRGNPKYWNNAFTNFGDFI